MTLSRRLTVITLLITFIDIVRILLISFLVLTNEYIVPFTGREI